MMLDKLAIALVIITEYLRGKSLKYLGKRGIMPIHNMPAALDYPEIVYVSKRTVFARHKDAKWRFVK